MASMLPSAKELMAKAAEKAAQKAAEAMRLQAQADAEKKALIERLQQPSGLSDEEALRRVKVIIERAVNNQSGQNARCSPPTSVLEPSVTPVLESPPVRKECAPAGGGSTGAMIGPGDFSSPTDFEHRNGRFSRTS